MRRILPAVLCALLFGTVSDGDVAAQPKAGCYCRMLPLFDLPEDPMNPPPEPYCLFFGLVMDDCEQCTDPLICTKEEPCSKPWPCNCGESGNCCEPELLPVAAAKSKFHGLKYKAAPNVVAALPKLKAGTWNVVSEMFVEFAAEDGRVRQAKVFLIGVEPEGKNKKGDATLIGLGYEVTHIPAGATKFSVRKTAVQKAGLSNYSYRVTVGATQFLVLLAQ